MNWLRKKLKKWLGIKTNEIDIERLDILYSDLTSIGVDVHFKKPHMILIFSKLNGGQIRHIDADFDNMQELNSLVKALKKRYKPKDIFYDLPHGMNKQWLK